MYARHGADFLDKEIKRHFSTFEWYHPNSGQTYDETEKLFGTIELYNLKLLALLPGCSQRTGPLYAPDQPVGWFISSK